MSLRSSKPTVDPRCRNTRSAHICERTRREGLCYTAWGCAASCGGCQGNHVPTVQVVLCRFTENITWAVQAFAGTPQIRLIVYNSGPLLSLGPEVDERHQLNYGREASCVLRHLIIQKAVARKQGAPALSNFTIFSQAAPSTQSDIVHAAFALAMRRATLAPKGFVPLASGNGMNWGWAGSPHRTCWRAQWSNMTGLPKQLYHWYHDRLTFTPTSEFVVTRSSVLAAPGWLLRAALKSLEDTEPLPWNRDSPKVKALGFSFSSHELRSDSGLFCCAYSCYPWILERMWEVLLSPETTLELPDDDLQGASAAPERGSPSLQPPRSVLRNEGTNSSVLISQRSLDMHRRLDLNVGTLFQRFKAGMTAEERAAFYLAIDNATLLQSAAAQISYNMSDWPRRLRRFLNPQMPLARYDWRFKLLGPSKFCVRVMTEPIILHHSIPRLRTLRTGTEMLHGRSDLPALLTGDAAKLLSLLLNAMRLCYARCVHHEFIGYTDEAVKQLKRTLAQGCGLAAVSRTASAVCTLPQPQGRRAKPHPPNAHPNIPLQP